MPKLGGRQMLHEVIERERHLQTELAGRLAAPFDATFDLLEQSGATLHSQADAVESAGRALEEAATLMKSQAELSQRTVETLRGPAELAKSAAGLERHQRVAHREPNE
jgi:hypothetical protein